MVRRWISQIARRVLIRAFPEQLAEIDNLRINFVSKRDFEALRAVVERQGADMERLQAIIDQQERTNAKLVEKLDIGGDAGAVQELKAELADLKRKTDHWARKLILAQTAVSCGQPALASAIIAAEQQAIGVYHNRITVALLSETQPLLISFSQHKLAETAIEDAELTFVGDVPNDIIIDDETRTRFIPALKRLDWPSECSSNPISSDYETTMARISDQPELMNFLSGLPQEAQPILRPIAANPKTRSAVFLNNNYYHYNQLSEALRNRGWDAITVSNYRPDDPQRQFFHGEDCNLYHPDPNEQARRSARFFHGVPERFANLHFYGRGLPSFFPSLYQNLEPTDPVPWDMLALREHRTLIGYMPSGCLDGGLPHSIKHQGLGVCDRCVWQTRSDVCSVELNGTWNRRIEDLCDWIGLEGDHQTPERSSSRYVADPIVTCLSPETWAPELDVPIDMRFSRAPDTVLVYHAVGNYRERRTGERDIKGTGVVFLAIETLKAEGLPIELLFASNVPSTEVRFLQVQADIVVDQLNYGRYGANAREAMMLGKPVVARKIPQQAPGLTGCRSVAASPIVDACEGSITDILRDLVQAPKRRTELASQSRSFALEWHGRDACAERFERLTDAVANGDDPASVDVWPEL